MQRLTKAQADGQLRVDVDPLDIVELVYAPLYYRLILGTRALSASDSRRQLQRTLDGPRTLAEAVGRTRGKGATWAGTLPSLPGRPP